MADGGRLPAHRSGRPSSGAREAILAGALELIRERGLAAVTTREVARRAGVSEASVFYHFQDKVGLLQEVMLAGLEPLKGLDLDLVARNVEQPLGDTLLQIGTALEEFFDRALPILESVQADAALRTAFAGRLSERDLGPHRGVRFVAGQLIAASTAGAAEPGVRGEPVALLLVGACFLRCWQRHLDGPGRMSTLPSLPDTVEALAGLLGAPAGRRARPQG